MLRPEMVIQYAKQRGRARASDFCQLVDGIHIGGRIIVGGGHENARSLMTVMTGSARMGVVLATNEIKEPLDPNVTYTFDIMAIMQQVMIAKNEAFHATIDQAINLLQSLCVDEGQPIEVGLQVLREQADKIGHL